MRDIEIQKKIDAYINGRLNEEEIEALWAEFAKNPDLLIDLEVEVGVKELISEKKDNEQQASSVVHKLPRWTWHVAAAAVIAIVALVQLFRTDTPTELHEFVVTEIEAGQLETTDNIRSSGSEANPADSLLTLAFEAFLNGDIERALQILDQVIADHNEEPYASKAWLNKGIILYNEGNFEQSTEALMEAASRSSDSKMINEKAYWYLGNALVNRGELEQAREAVYQAYALDGIFKKPAFRLLVKLNYELGYSDYEEDFQIEALD